MHLQLLANARHKTMCMCILYPIVRCHYILFFFVFIAIYFHVFFLLLFLLGGYFLKRFARCCNKFLNSQHYLEQISRLFAFNMLLNCSVLVYSMHDSVLLAFNCLNKRIIASFLIGFIVIFS